MSAAQHSNSNSQTPPSPRKLVIHPAVDEPRLFRIRQAAGAMRVVNAADELEAIREIADADAFFGKLTPGMLAVAERLRWVQSPTASLEHYVFGELIEHPLVLTNMRGLFSDVIADQVLGYVICFARNLHIYIRHQAAGRWAPEGGESARVSFATGPGTLNDMHLRHQHLAGMTLGVVGLGSIGMEVARRAAAFAMRVVAIDPQPRKQLTEVERIWPPEQLSELLAISDYVVIAAPHTPESAGMFRRPQLQAMRRTAYLINIGRGALLDLEDLCAALEAGEIAGAALDVFQQEPLPANHRLWQLPNVILTPHVAGYSPQIPVRHLALLLDNIQRFATGQPLRNVVDKRLWY
jgi:phosphoglycerate dehydrogenase-like enzyme